jgi:hypothetical protein
MDLSKSNKLFFNTVMDNSSDKESNDSSEFMIVAPPSSDHTKRQKHVHRVSMRPK